jgi:hypothetical protein
MGGDNKHQPRFWSDALSKNLSADVPQINRNIKRRLTVASQSGSLLCGKPPIPTGRKARVEQLFWPPHHAINSSVIKIRSISNIPSYSKSIMIVGKETALIGCFNVSMFASDQSGNLRVTFRRASVK